MQSKATQSEVTKVAISGEGAEDTFHISKSTAAVDHLALSSKMKELSTTEQLNSFFGVQFELFCSNQSTNKLQVPRLQDDHPSSEVEEVKREILHQHFPKGETAEIVGLLAIVLFCMVPIIVLTYLLQYTREDFMQNHQEPINTANMKIRADIKIRQFWKCQKIARINNTSAIKIQRCFRNHLHTAPHDNIIGVNLNPSIFTDHWQRHEISSAIAIQAHIRSWYARRNVLAMKQAIVKIQAFSRSWMCRMTVAIMNVRRNRMRK